MFILIKNYNKEDLKLLMYIYDFDYSSFAFALFALKHILILSSILIWILSL